MDRGEILAPLPLYFSGARVSGTYFIDIPLRSGISKVVHVTVHYMTSLKSWIFTSSTRTVPSPVPPLRHKNEFG
ncbi:hypothetical protein K443DRAFT_359606 [Laccaria amethystina LaAM-08-1]|uniref:Uncharacterized protein n=1 Tax=Laccaria amethystina LaAM-08-1 TaxID=1095629 RepID=A0A0C9Y552_9AGAR|nr:hypothetical protein K443DRAFT_359606 [Laccaria amethystina LaAM-08-1]